MKSTTRAMTPLAVRAPKVELKSVAYNARLSKETNNFAAVIWVDGVKTAEVGNEGHGGCDDHRVLNKAKWEELQAYVTSLPATESHGTALPMEMDIYIGDLLDAYLHRKDLVRLCSKKTLYRLKDTEYEDGVWVVIPRPYSAEVKAHLVLHHGDNLGRIANEELAAAAS